jgi:alkylation response protein AidB-like acyl-CoA dehydrogenase
VRDNTLTGTKIQVPDAVGADYLFVTTANGVYLVATHAKGLTITPTECLDGSRRFAKVCFDNVAGTRLGDKVQLVLVIYHMPVALCADGLGATQRTLELAALVIDGEAPPITVE